MKPIILLFSTFLGLCSAQGPLDTFAEIRNSLLDGSALQLNADSAGCDTTNVETPLLVSMPLRQWQIITLATGGEEIRADDFYIDTPDSTGGTYIIRTINIYDDDSVLVTLTIGGSGGNGTVLQLTMDCVLGVGALAHRIINGNDLLEVDTYEELKTELLLGDHVEAVGYLNDCLGGDTAFPNGNQYIVGYQIRIFDVVNDGTPDEFIYFDDVAVLSSDGSTFSVGAEQVVILRDGSAAVTIAVMDGNLSPITTFSLVCNLGSSLRFTVHRRENEETYSTYSAIKAATLSGHDMEMVVFLGNCDVLEGGVVNTPGTIVSARADEFHLYKAGTQGDQEFILYSAWGLDVLGDVYADVARLYEDGTLTVEYFVYGPNGIGEVMSGLLSCPLTQASLFHAVPRNRDPVTDYNEIITDIQTRGQIFEIEIDYDACTNPSTNAGIIFGGIAWETYIDPSPTGGFFYADEFTLVKANSTGTPAWDTVGISLFPDGSVFVVTRLYEFSTGENLSDETEVIVCLLGEAVTFFRYP